MTNGTHYYKYRTRSRRDPADLQKQLGKKLSFLRFKSNFRGYSGYNIASYKN